jgi:hypothetical protein
MRGRYAIVWRANECSGCSTITPIRVMHDFQLQVFYAVEGETIAGAPCEGPGELRMMQVKIPIIVPSVGPLVSCDQAYVAMFSAAVQPARSPCQYVRIFAIVMWTHLADCRSDEPAGQSIGENIDDVLNSPPAKQRCMCGNTFAELGEAAMRSLPTIETEEIDAMTREGSGSGASGSGVPGGRVEKEGEGRRNSGVGDRGGT